MMGDLTLGRRGLSLGQLHHADAGGDSCASGRHGETSREGYFEQAECLKTAWIISALGSLGEYK